MSTVVVVKKAGKVCIAADSLTSFGDLKLNSMYDAAHDKILHHDENYLGIVGLSLIHISEPTRPPSTSRMPSSA